MKIGETKELQDLMNKVVDLCQKEEIPMDVAILGLMYTSASIAHHVSDRPEAWVSTMQYVAMDVWDEKKVG